MAEIKNLDLSVIQRRKFTIDGNPDNVIELNTSDFLIVDRLREAYPKLQALSEQLQAPETNENDLEGTLNTLGDFFKDIDKQMRELVDYIFDADVCSHCVPTGSMYDLHEGAPTYDHIITILSGLYENNLSEEVKKVNKRISKHTSKYTGK